jgi:hypothetical protein
MSFDDHTIAERTLTPNDIMTILVDHQRLEREAGCCLMDDLLDESSTVSRWISSRDLCFVDDAAKHLNELFHLRLSYAQWREILTPRSQRTLAELSEFIASQRLPVPRIEPVTVMGSTSLAAGVFLVIRKVLRDAGADVSDLRPSSPLKPYLMSHARPLVESLSKIAPGRLPPLEIDDSMAASFGCAMQLTWLIALVCRIAGIRSFEWQLNVTIGVALALHLLARFLDWTRGRPLDLRFVWVRDFRDLSRVIAGERAVGAPGFPVTLIVTSSSNDGD